jgi:hypothetical protein
MSFFDERKTLAAYHGSMHSRPSRPLPGTSAALLAGADEVIE